MCKVNLQSVYKRETCFSGDDFYPSLKEKEAIVASSVWYVTRSNRYMY